MNDNPRVQLSHYRVENEIGRGGMGVVYRAVDTRLGRAVAIKMLPHEATSDPERRARFIQEARSASALNHPHIVTIYDVGEQDGATFIAMELLDGEPLDRRLRKGPIGLGEAVQLALQIASAVATAHGSGIVHRDIKPANIIITSDGRAKILDFGLAKLAERVPTEVTVTGVGTRPGVILGTAAYMSPEQAESHPVDGRSDLFSFGAVLYEMLTGRRPFAADSDIGLITAILRDQPTPLQSIRADVPPQLQQIVERCLEKDPRARFADARAVKAALEEVQTALVRQPPVAWRRSAVLVPALLVLTAVAGLGGWQLVKARRVSSALAQIREVERLTQTSGHGIQAMRMVRDAERHAPGEAARMRERWNALSFISVPEDASVELKDYVDANGSWEPLGKAPIRGLYLPFGSYRARLSRPGYESVEFSLDIRGSAPVRLWQVGTTPGGMVFVAGGNYSIGVTRAATLPDFWIDRTEVTNREFKRFADAGGYRDPRYWKQPFVTSGGTLTFDEAMTRFRDSTGRTGPATWELGAYPEGRAEHPVNGISWYEAAAFAEFAGKSLPTVYHWNRAAGTDSFNSDVLRFSNVEGKDLDAVGRRPGLGPWGTLDMAGNVKEWCFNESVGDPRRYILGGAWNEPAYRFRDEEAMDPWSRTTATGVRLVKNLGAVTDAMAPIARIQGDPASLVPVDDAQFEVLKGFYAYDRTPIVSRVERTDDSSPYFRREIVSYAAAYNSERITAHLFLPKSGRAPFPTVLYFPSGYARASRSSDPLDMGFVDFVVRSGRAILYPVYKGTFERGGGVASGGPSGTRDMQVAWGKDVFRSVDYLATRSDLDLSHLAYYGVSMGAYFGPIPVSLDPRFKVGVFAAGGLRFNYPPEIQAVNFLPHVTVPVLLVNGRDDFSASVEAQQRFYTLAGTPIEHKRHVMLEGGHVPNDFRGLIREILDFLDKYQRQ
jgi:predicted Ser/Thr protein kinase